MRKQHLENHPLLSEKEAFLKLHSLGQSHILEYWASLSAAQKANLIAQISLLDVSLFKCLQHTATTQQIRPIFASPFKDYFHSDPQNDALLGEQLLMEGKTALVVLAGGQGSRLQYNGAKGCFPITSIRHKSLYQLLAEKIFAAGKQAKRALEVAVMTSPLNHLETQKFFEEHDFFGLQSDQISFFCQEMFPLLDFQGNLFLEEIDQIACGPNGNGGVFRRLMETVTWDKWNAMGIELIHVLPIDNPLATPFDAELFGFHKRNGNEITLKSAFRRNGAESVGVLAHVEGKTAVIEYINLSEKEKQATDLNGRLKFQVANLGMYCFSMPFLKAACTQTLPLHAAKKAVKMLGQEGTSQFSPTPNAWKFEEFIFDLFPLASHVQALMCPRETCFAPLKNFNGEDSIEAVRAALLANDWQVFAKLTGNKPPLDAQFELAPQFYYPTLELREKWKGRPFPNKEYIDD